MPVPPFRAWTGWAFALYATAAVAADAPPGGFALPIACSPDRDCWVLNYPDADPGPAALDAWCGPRSYDTHHGIDIAIRDLARMRTGVAVLAAAAGTVRAARDGMADTPFVDGTQAALAGRDCGNGAIVDHGGGWETQYCHMRRGSLAVRPGDRVERGQALGLVGLSGRTQYPHVHLTIRRNGEPLDPATGRPLAAGCDPSANGHGLWQSADTLPRSDGALYAAGFAPGPVTAQRIKDDASSQESLPRDAPALVLWAAMFGVRAGDSVRFEIVAPDGRVALKREQRIARDQAWRLEFSGVRRPAEGWTAGIWRGRASLRRAGAETPARSRAVEVTFR